MTAPKRTAEAPPGQIVGAQGLPIAAARPTVGGRLAGDGVGEPEVFHAPGQREMQARADEAAARGFHGAPTDPTPADHYTVAGVLAGKPTPETERRS